MHVAVGPPYTLRLKVKFYSSEPNSLREELTRYQFFLQLKQDILQGRLDCVYQTAVELSALALQCEYCAMVKRTEKYTEFHKCICCDSVRFSNKNSVSVACNPLKIENDSIMIALSFWFSGWRGKFSDP